MSIYLGTTPVANTGYDKANTDLSNLTSTGKNIANWSNNVTNCITEIPQDIKLELNNGTLTLKAGSKVYFGDGSSYILTTDKTRPSGSSGNVMIVYRKTSNTLVDMPIANCVSGATQPTGGNYFVWYDTTNNITKYTAKGFSTWEECSLPICTAIFENGVPISIDQVFNGFGYIGSTVFALPGVKGLIPNGRNEDGSLKNPEITVSSVATNSVPSVNFTNINAGITANGDIDIQFFNYKENENLLYNGSGARVAEVCVASFNVESGVIKNFVPKTAFHALDYNDSSTISGWSMPSSRYIDLTIGASGATYTAPANGWLSWYCHQNNNGYIFVQSSASLLPNRVANSSNDIAGFIPVKQGDRIYVEYNNLAFNRLRFIYAEGEN